MTERLDVAVNRDGMHTLDVQENFETGGTFVVELRNYGEPAHVYLNLDDQLSELARIEATNHYVEADERRTVDVEVKDSTRWPRDTIRGKLKVVVGHGQETRWVDVTFDRTPDKEPVEVDPELTRMSSGPEHADPDRRVIRLLPVGVLAVVAVILAVGALFATDGVDFALAGISVVAAGLCAVAAHYLYG